MSILMYPLIVYFSLAMRAGGVKKFKSEEETKEEFPNLLYSKEYLLYAKEESTRVNNL